MKRRLALPLVASGILLGACTVIPTGPSIMAMPGSRTTLEQYQADVAYCQRYADAVIAAASGATAANADNQAATTAATAAFLGAATGALIGSVTGQAGQGAAIGAGTGLLFGTAAGSPYTSMSSYQLQRGYDRAYLQCMYDRGHQVPTSRDSAATRQRPANSGSSTEGYRPPPPPGGYPPPTSAPASNYPPPDAPPPPPAPPRN